MWIAAGRHFRCFDVFLFANGAGYQITKWTVESPFQVILSTIFALDLGIGITAIWIGTRAVIDTGVTISAFRTTDLVLFRFILATGAFAQTRLVLVLALGAYGRGIVEFIIRPWSSLLAR